ncbi:MAG: hypothetical protein AAFZ18_17825, partial [Myxococcota bacterium]
MTPADEQQRLEAFASAANNLSQPPRAVGRIPAGTVLAPDFDPPPALAQDLIRRCVRVFGPIHERGQLERPVGSARNDNP